MITVDNVFARVDGVAERTAVGRLLRYRRKGYRFTQAYRMGRWDGWASVMDRYGRFPAGLLTFVTSRLAESSLAPEIRDTRVRPPPHPAIAPASLSARLMPHQEEAVASAYEAGRGVIHHPVGSGKTLVLVELVRRCAVPALVLTHRKDLLRQLYREFTTNLNIPGLVGVIGDGRWDENWIVVATFQSINAALKNYPDQAKAFLATRQAVLVDEIQHLVAATYERVMKEAKAAFYRYGCSATPDKEGDPEAKLKVEGWTGPVMSHYTPDEGVDFGRLVPADIFVVSYGAVERDEPWPEEYEHSVVRCADRNGVVAKIAALAPKPVLVLVERIKHGRRLTELMQTAHGQRATFIFGEDSSRVREGALQGFRDGLHDVLVSSVILDEGIDLPNIRTLILAGGGKAKHRIIQRVGRGQRRSGEKRRLVVFDLKDRGKYTGRHAAQRLKTYRGQAAYDVFECAERDVVDGLREGLVEGALT